MVVTKNAAESLSSINFKKTVKYFSFPTNKAGFKCFCALQLNSFQEYWTSTSYSDHASKVQLNPKFSDNINKFYSIS